MKTAVSTSRAPAPGGAYSQAIRHGDLLLLAGQTGLDPDTGLLAEGVEGQTEQAIRNIAAVLEHAGGSLADVLKTTCFLADVGDFATFNSIYERAFPQPYPARSTFGVALAGDLLVEIEAVAVVPEKS